jgi:hypothetical protein
MNGGEQLQAEGRLESIHELGDALEPLQRLRMCGQRDTGILHRPGHELQRLVGRIAPAARKPAEPCHLAIVELVLVGVGALLGRVPEGIRKPVRYQFDGRSRRCKRSSASACPAPGPTRASFRASTRRKRTSSEAAGAEASVLSRKAHAVSRGRGRSYTYPLPFRVRGLKPRLPAPLSAGGRCRISGTSLASNIRR